MRGHRSTGIVRGRRPSQRKPPSWLFLLRVSCCDSCDQRDPCIFAAVSDRLWVHFAMSAPGKTESKGEQKTELKGEQKTELKGEQKSAGAGSAGSTVAGFDQKTGQLTVIVEQSLEAIAEDAWKVGCACTDCDRLTPGRADCGSLGCAVLASGAQGEREQMPLLLLQQLLKRSYHFAQVSKDGKSRSMSMPTPEGIPIELVETLIERNDSQRFYTYAVTGPGLPYTDHWSKFGVVENGAVSKIVWETRFVRSLVAQATEPSFSCLSPPQSCPTH